MVLGLARMHELLQRLGAPHEHLGTIFHVGGTNGKGSTCAMLSAIARAAGVRCARYTSPHLTSLRERIVVDDVAISETEFVEHARRVAAAGGDAFTFFEQVTAIAFSYFATCNVEVSVVEVGLGGRLDATNVVAADVAIVTGVDIDHEAVLGATAQQIAFEKAGIFKTGRAAVVGISGLTAAVPHLAAHARAAGVASLRIVDESALATVPPLGLTGAHQRRNAAAAMAAVAALGSLANRFTPALINAGLAAVHHPGRFEQLPGSPTVILDGAHNVAGAHALAASMVALPNYERNTTALVIAVSADKQVPELLTALLPFVGMVVATRYQQDRAKPSAELAALCANQHPNVAQAASLAEALAIAQGAPAVTHIIVAGSLFLVGEARTLLCGAVSDPWLVTDPVPRIAT